jgi:hypoxanthine phosphoribosyltransferase
MAETPVVPVTPKTSEIRKIVKLYITPDSLRVDSFKLAQKCVFDKFIPDYMVAIWRGGATIGCYVHEYFKYMNTAFTDCPLVDHIAIRTSRYTGIDEAHDKVQVHNLGYLVERLKPESKVLLVDDVFDTGLSIDAVYKELQNQLGANCPKDIRTATVYYKPTRNRTTRIPNYYVNKTDEWIVFPHELEGMHIDEIEEVFGKEIEECVANGFNSVYYSYPNGV